MRVPCKPNPLQGICSSISDLERQIALLEAQGAIDLSDLAPLDHEHEPPDMSGYATDAELAAGLATKSDTGHTHASYGGLVDMVLTEATTTSNTVVNSGQSKLLANFAALVFYEAGNTIEVDLTLPCYVSGGSGSPNLIIDINANSQTKRVGQIYQNIVVDVVSANVVFSGFSTGWVTVSVTLSAYSGKQWTFCDHGDRLARMTVKHWNVTY